MLTNNQKADLRAAARYLASNNDENSEMAAAEADRIAAVLLSLADGASTPQAAPENLQGQTVRMPTEDEIARAIRMYDPHEDIYKAQAAIRCFIAINAGRTLPPAGERGQA